MWQSTMTVRLYGVSSELAKRTKFFLHRSCDGLNAILSWYLERGPGYDLGHPVIDE